MILCEGLDLSLCPESSFGAGRDQRACNGFYEVDRVVAQRDVGYDRDRREPQWMKNIAYRVIAAYAMHLADEREASTPRCRAGRRSMSARFYGSCLGA